AITWTSDPTTRRTVRKFVASASRSISAQVGRWPFDSFKLFDSVLFMSAINVARSACRTPRAFVKQVARKRSMARCALALQVAAQYKVTVSVHSTIEPKGNGEHYCRSQQLSQRAKLNTLAINDG